MDKNLRFRQRSGRSQSIFRMSVRSQVSPGAKEIKGSAREEWVACAFFFTVTISASFLVVGILVSTVVESGILWTDPVLKMRRFLGGFSIDPIQLMALEWVKKMKHYHQITSPHIYSDLREGEFRVLVLEAGRPESEVNCRLITCRYDDGLPYDALSYFWGNPERTVPIKCNGQTHLVSINLHTALHSLRRQTEDRILWVDALCINQDDVAERGDQVQNMASIYSQARRTLVWLGSREAGLMSNPLHLLARYNVESAISKAVFQATPSHVSFGDGFIGLDLSKARKEGDLLNRDWQPLIALLELPWFTRLWVIQEVACARRAVILFGESSIGWDRLAQPVAELYHSGLLQNDITKKGERGARAVIEIQSIRERIRKGCPPNLLELLLATGLADCSDPRDKVYGVLSLAGDYDKDHDDLKPDYQATTQDVYKKVARWCVEKADTDMLLSSATTSQWKDLPSWVPDWSNTENNFPFIWSSRSFNFDSTNSAHSTDHSEPAHAKPRTVGDGILVLAGVSVDVIDEVGPLFQLRRTGMSQPLDLHSQALAANMEWLQNCSALASKLAKKTDNEHFRWKMSFDVKRRFGVTMMASMTGDGYAAPSMFLKWFDNYMLWLQTDYRQWISDEYAKNDRKSDDVKRVSSSDDILLPESLYSRSIAAIESSLSMWASKRRFAVTRTGRMVLAPQRTIEGDIIMLVEGCKVPYVFRHLKDEEGELYAVVGEVFVEDLMSGEFFESICGGFGSAGPQDRRVLKEFQVK